MCLYDLENGLRHGTRNSVISSHVPNEVRELGRDLILLVTNKRFLLPAVGRNDKVVEFQECRKPIFIKVKI